MRLALAAALLLLACASWRPVLGAPSTPDTRKKKAKPKPKPKPKPKAVKTNTRKPKAPSRKVQTTAQKTSPKPAPVASAPVPAIAPATNLVAGVPAVNLPASVWRGCLEARDLAKLASGLGLDESRLEPLLSNFGLVPVENSPCVPYVAATGGAGGAASAVFRRPDPKPGEAPILDLRKAADGITITPGACDCTGLVRGAVDFSLVEVSQRPNEVLGSLPSNVRWQLDTILPKIIGRIGSADTSAFTLRIGLDRKGPDQPQYLRSFEILESGTGKSVTGAWWLERAGGPGVLIGMDGVSLERLLWQSPLRYVQKSRGPGPAVATYSRVTNFKNRKPLLRFFSVREYHLGSDLLAPKGTEVHAVGDAKVSFAGKMGGYGNLIILDHGLGYQTYYAHLSVITPFVKQGATIARGDLIGLVGSTGRSTAPHLHFEARKDTKYIDPFDTTSQMDFWLLTGDEQERLAMELLALPPPPVTDTNDATTGSSKNNP